MRSGAQLEDQGGDEDRRRYEQQGERREIAGRGTARAHRRSRGGEPALVRLPDEAGQEKQDDCDPADELAVVPSHRREPAIPGARALPGSRQQERRQHEEDRGQGPWSRGEPREPAERRPGLFAEHEISLAVDRHELDDPRAVHHHVDSQRAHLVRAQPVRGRVVGRRGRLLPGAEQRPLPVHGVGARCRPAIDQRESGGLGLRPAPRGRADGRAPAGEDARNVTLGLHEGPRGGFRLRRRRLVGSGALRRTSGRLVVRESSGGHGSEDRHRAQRQKRSRHERQAKRLREQPAEPASAGGRGERGRVVAPADPLGARMAGENSVVVGPVLSQPGVAERPVHVLIDEDLPALPGSFGRLGRAALRTQDAHLEHGASGVVPGDREAVLPGACDHTPRVHVGDDLVGVAHLPPAVR